MKNTLLLSILALVFTTFGFAAADKDKPCREISIHTEKVGDAVHWMPAKIEVKQGEKVRFIAKHELEGGFDFHGFEIPALNIKQQVDRKKPLSLEVTVPETLKVGEYPINCQFHKAHVGAKLVVLAGEHSQDTAKKTKKK